MSLIAKQSLVVIVDGQSVYVVAGNKVPAGVDSNVLKSLKADKLVGSEAVAEIEAEAAEAVETEAEAEAEATEPGKAGTSK